jgi:hypothetical protein
VVLDPDRVLFQWGVVVELEVIVVVIGVAVVLVHEILAQDVIGERVARLFVIIVGLGHANVLRQPRSARSGAVLWHGRFAAVKTPAGSDAGGIR